MTQIWQFENYCQIWSKWATMVTFTKGWNHINFQNVISWSNFYQISKSQWVLDSIFPELQDSHITSSNLLRFNRDMKCFNNPIKSSNFVISIAFFENVITWSYVCQILKSQAFLESSFPGLQDSHIVSWISWSFKGVMTGFPRVLSYRNQPCNWANRRTLKRKIKLRNVEDKQMLQQSRDVKCVIISIKFGK